MRTRNWWKGISGAIAVGSVLAVIGMGCERDHYPPSNEKKLDHQERIKDKYDVPTNRNDRSEPDWDK